jgi:hypothetical protein
VTAVFAFGGNGRYVGCAITRNNDQNGGHASDAGHIRQATMGQQQLLLIILGVIIVGVAILVGLSMARAHRIETYKDAMVNDLSNIAADAIAYKTRTSTMGGGQGGFTGYTLPVKFAANVNGTYTATPSLNSITVVGTSSIDPVNSITVVIDSQGKLTSWTYGGDFQ